MKEYEMLSYSNEELKFVELWYLDGPKLSVNMDKQYLFIWNNEFDEFETWFMLKPTIEYFEKYLKNEITILEVMKNTKVELIHRTYSDYGKLNIINSDYEIEQDSIPGENSFLSFNIFNELQEEVKIYEIKITLKEDIFFYVHIYKNGTFHSIIDVGDIHSPLLQETLDNGCSLEYLDKDKNFEKYTIQPVGNTMIEKIESLKKAIEMIGFEFEIKKVI